MNSAKQAPPYYYCYVDESGQHTMGKYFVVALTMIPADQSTLDATTSRCLKFEAQSQKGPVKWADAIKPFRLRYAQLIFADKTLQDLDAKMYIATYRNTKEYDWATFDAIRWVLQTYFPQMRTTVLIDGKLQKTKRQEIATFLRRDPDCNINKVVPVKKRRK